MAVIVVAAGPQPGSDQAGPLTAPEMTPVMTLGETVTTPTTTTSILSFRPGVTAAPAPGAEPGD